MKLYRIPREGNVQLAGQEIRVRPQYAITIIQAFERATPRLQVFFTDLHPIPKLYRSEDDINQS